MKKNLIHLFVLLFLSMHFLCIAAGGNEAVAAFYAEKVSAMKKSADELMRAMVTDFSEFFYPPGNYQLKEITPSIIDQIIEKVTTYNQKGLCAIFEQLVDQPDDAWKQFAVQKSSELINTQSSCVSFLHKIDQSIDLKKEILQYERLHERYRNGTQAEGLVPATSISPAGLAASDDGIVLPPTDQVPIIDLQQKSFLNILNPAKWPTYLQVASGLLALTVASVALYKFFKKPKEAGLHPNGTTLGAAAPDSENSVPNTD